MVLSATHFRFGEFRLDAAGRQLWNGNEPVELNGRYFDGLLLLVREQGQLLPKDRFFEEVWAGVVVSDSALTQGIKEIRKQLGYHAANPRFVQTVPRYGYRFVAPAVLEEANQATTPTGPVPFAEPKAQGTTPLDRAIRHAIAGTFGGGRAAGRFALRRNVGQGCCWWLGYGHHCFGLHEPGPFPGHGRWLRC